MNYLIEIIYLLLALVFLLILSVNLTMQILNIYQIERNLRNCILARCSKTAYESLTYNISQIYIKKCQWIEAIQTLQFTLRKQKLYSNINGYSLANLCNALGYVYGRTHQYIAAKHYFRLALTFNPKHIGASRGLKRIRN